MTNCSKLFKPFKPPLPQDKIDLLWCRDGWMEYGLKVRSLFIVVTLPGWFFGRPRCFAAGVDVHHVACVGLTGPVRLVAWRLPHWPICPCSSSPVTAQQYCPCLSWHTPTLHLTSCSAICNSQAGTCCRWCIFYASGNHHVYFFCTFCTFIAFFKGEK